MSLSCAGVRTPARQREHEAYIDQLTVRQRTAYALARKLTAEELERVIEAQLAKAKEGGVHAFRALVELVKLAGGRQDEDEGEGLRWEQLTPAQRAAARAQLMAQIEEEQALQREDEGA